MKECSHKSRKHSKHSHSKREDKSDHSTNESDKYRNVLKERHYKEVSELKKDEKHKHDSKHENRSKRERDKPLQKKIHSKPDVFSSSGKSEVKKHKKQKHQESVEESYEELSRKKQRIESELLALDLEEAAVRQANNIRDKRQTSDSMKRKEKPRTKDKPSRSKEEPVHVKQEPISDDDSRKRRGTAKIQPSQSSTSESRNQTRHSQPSTTTGNDWGNSQAESRKPEKPKEKPNFGVSGKLAEDTNVYNGVVIKYNEPSEARKPRRRWRLYPFKGDTDLPFIPIHRQSAYLFGRTRSIADIPIDHPSCSKQHAVLQFRLVSYKREDNTTGRRVRPYIIDLESSNGTFVNNKQVEARKYVELMEKDVVKFGFSSREYVVLHEESKKDEEDDDVLDSN